ncbi:MAG: NAD(P)-dependent oxidoreductase [Spirochaetales bacterium]|nr:NAD(P)-dependent oxidoreductase [Spirochaetales bacterium]
MKQAVGLIGVGNMGRIILRQLVDAEYPVVAYDPSPASQKTIKESAAELVNSPRDVGLRAQLTILSLPAPKNIHDVLWGDKGLFETLRQGAIVIDTSTVDPQITKKAYEACLSRNGGYLDAPVLGRPASFGKWVLPVGGDEVLLKTVEPVLRTFAAKIVHVGTSGSGHTLKLLNQLMFSAINAITAEMFAIADKMGMPRKKIFDVIASSGAATVSGLFMECGKKIVDNDFTPIFPIDLLCKDAGLGIEMADFAGAPPVISSTIQYYNRIAQTQGIGDLDTSALIQVFNRLYSREQG